MKKIFLTGDRPTGKLHLGHYVGSLKNRLLMQKSNEFDEMYIMIADSQALTDNFLTPEKVRDSVTELLLDYLAIGIDPKKINIFIQSEVKALPELYFYYNNFVTLSRLLRNPTVKGEIDLRGFENNIPIGFLTYPVSQTADITGFDATHVPVGTDQLPMIEQAREIVKSFNNTYGETLVLPEAIIPNNVQGRLPGTDGVNKMSKSLNNAIYLSDSDKDIIKKVNSMYTDPNHIDINDPGEIEGNVVFTYLDIFCDDNHFVKYLSNYKNLDELKNHYKKGGLGDSVTKKFLSNVLIEFITPIREKREILEKDGKYLYEVLKDGTKVANDKVNGTLKRVKKNMKINYFDNDEYLSSLLEKYK